MSSGMVVVHPYLTAYQRDLLIKLVQQERERVLNWEWLNKGDPAIDVLNRVEEELKQAK